MTVSIRETGVNIMSVLAALLKVPMDYSRFQNSFAPLYSSYSLCLDGKFSGINTLALHYNRKTRALWKPFLKLAGQVTDYEAWFDYVKLTTDKAEMWLSFYDMDTGVIRCKTPEPVEFFCEADEMLSDAWIAAKSSREVFIQGYSRNPDARDPDPRTAVLAGIRVLKGNLSVRKGICRVLPEETGEIYVAFSASVMNVSLPELRKKLAAAPATMDDARKILCHWAEGCIGPDLQMPKREDAREAFLRAVSGLLMNLTLAPGELGGHISSFPNRGGYPTHFLWDSAFQNLAYEMMNPDLARDSVLQLTDNIRADGRISHFHCSTWSRPVHTQPALTGWMSLRFLDEVDGEDKEFMRQVLPALEANNHWWLNQRMTKFGLIYCDDGLETGQDNSPRFDNGAILALDMNSYVVNQMRCTAEIARRLGQKRKATQWDKEADRLAGLMVKYLYDPEQNMFFDAYADSGKRQTLVTSSAMLPLWCGVPLPEEKIQAMIRDWMLNPQKLYGNIPFPSVAYDQDCYDAGGWWRGPTWMSEAWLLLEALKLHGFAQERKETMAKFYEMMIKDGLLHELFNSQTGEGLGNVEQGWTAATFIRIGVELDM